MKILVLSDSHRDAISCMMAIRKHPEAEYIIHLGDGEDDLDGLSTYTAGKKIVRVRGNCSRGSIEPERRIIEIGGKKIYCCHGHIEGVKMGLDKLISYAIAEGCEIALFGHTHRQEHLYLSDAGLHLFNPGSVRSGEYGMIDIVPGSILCSEARL